MAKPVSPELLAVLNSRNFYRAELYTITLAGALGTLRYTSGDADISANGFLYSAGKNTGPYFDRRDNKAKIHQKVGFEVDTMIFDVLPGSATVLGAPFLHAIRIGVFDGALVNVETAFMPTYGDTRRGTIQRFNGRVVDIDAGRSVATFSINSWLELANITIPHNLYSPGCINSLGDISCTVNLSLAAFNTTGTTSTGSTPSLINATIAGGPFINGAFDHGKITFTSGLNNGYTQTIKKLTYGSPAAIIINGEYPTAPLNGDTFIIYFGCDKTPGLVSTLTGNTDGLTAAITGVAPSTIGVSIGAQVTGLGILANTLVVGVPTNTQVNLNNVTTSVNTAATYTFAFPNGCAKFSNQANYRGFPRIPQPVIAI